MVRKLLDYQAVDGELLKIETQLRSSEARKKYLQSKKFLDTVEETLSKLESRAGELSALYRKAKEDSEKLTEALSDYDGAVEGIESREEAEYLSKRAAELLDRLRRAENDAARLEQEIEGVVKSYNELKEKTEKMSKASVKYKKEFAELRDSRAEEKAAIEGKLKEIAAGIDEDVLKRYAAKRLDKIFPVLVETNGVSCSACGMELSIVEQSKLSENGVVECDNCRRFLYKK